jgi:hypothetical protein
MLMNVLLRRMEGGECGKKGNKEYHRLVRLGDWNSRLGRFFLSLCQKFDKFTIYLFKHK